MIELEMCIIMVLGAICFMSVGYAFATRHSLLAIENVERWINDTKSNQWVAYSIHKELEEKYIALLKEYEQYRGTVKCLEDLKKNGDAE